MSDVLAEALEHLVRGIVDHPDDVTVRDKQLRRGSILEVRVHPDDLGKVIGRNGRTATAFRTVARPHASKHEKTRIMEGKCHRCARWVAVEGIKDVEAKVREIFWWKHAAGCHQGDVLDGEADVFVEDEVWRAVVGDGDGVQGESEGEGDRESEDGEREDDRR